MSSSDESSASGNEVNTESDLVFISSFVKVNPIILNKSQVPSVKMNKKNAIEKLKIELQKKFGKLMDTKSIMKKVNNLKTCVKKKTDSEATGNRKIKLSAAEKNIYEAMKGINGDNPVFEKVPGHLDVGVAHSSSASTLSQRRERISRDHQELEPYPPQIPAIKKNKNRALSEYETDETRSLSNSELQRLVLLQQHHVLKLKKQKLEKELEKLNSSSGSRSENIVRIDDKDYYDLNCN